MVAQGGANVQGFEPCFDGPAHTFFDTADQCSALVNRGSFPFPLLAVFFRAAPLPCRIAVAVRPADGQPPFDFSQIAFP